MCVIIVSEQVKPSEALLRDADAVNGDGWGIAWRANGMVHWQKGLDIEIIVKMVADLPLPMVLHARIATIGGVSRELTHPFPIEGTPRLALAGATGRKGVLFHNGHIREWEVLGRIVGVPIPRMLKHFKAGKHVKHDPWSDSRAVAGIASRHGSQALEAIADDSGSRFCVMTPTTIRRWGCWHGQDGVMLSSPIMDYSAMMHGRYMVGVDCGVKPAPASGGMIVVRRDENGHHIATDYDEYRRWLRERSSTSIDDAGDDTPTKATPPVGQSDKRWNGAPILGIEDAWGD